MIKRVVFGWCSEIFFLLWRNKNHCKEITLEYQNPYAAKRDIYPKSVGNMIDIIREDPNNNKKPEINNKDKGK